MMQSDSQYSKGHTVVLTDDHAIVRHAVRTILENDDRYNVLAEADCADDAIALVKEHQPDILVLDIALPGKSGIEALHELNKNGCNTKVVILSMFEDEIKVKQALQAGASAYIFKNCSPKELVETLSKTASNERTVPKGYEHLLTNGNGDSLSKDPLGSLTKREREIFYMLAEGLPNRIIAKKLIISARTVETHRARVIKKLGFSSTADIIRYAIRNHLIMA